MTNAGTHKLFIVALLLRAILEQNGKYRKSENIGKTTHLGKGGSDFCRFTAARCSNWNGVNALIHVERISQWIGHQLRIDLQLVHERRTCSPHHLKIDPANT